MCLLGSGVGGGPRDESGISGAGRWSCRRGERMSCQVRVREMDGEGRLVYRGWHERGCGEVGW
jgi:hypothetical protein